MADRDHGEARANRGVLRRAQPLLGTFVEIAVCGAASDAMESAIDEAFAAVASVHRLMSFHEEESDVSRLNREAFARAVSVAPETFEVLAMAHDLTHASAGAFDITVAPVLERLGLLPSRGGEGAHLIESVGDPVILLPDGRVRFREGGVRIDLGGIAKGYAVDRAVAALRRCGIAAGVVNAGGDLAVFGPQSEAIQVRDPRDPGRALCEVRLRDGALATSARRVDPFSAAAAAGAIIDPRTAAPVTASWGASVRAPTCMLADALTKIVMVAGEAAAPLLARHAASALLVSGEGVHVTADWQDDVRLAA